MMILSMYTRQVSHCSPAKALSISRSKVAELLQRLKGILVNSYSPLFVTKAVFSWSAGSIFTSQKPDCKSKTEYHEDLCNTSRESFILGRGYESFIVTSLTLRSSTQNLMEPSDLRTITIGEPQGDLEGLITPTSNIRFNSCETSSFWYMGIRLGACFMKRA